MSLKYGLQPGRCETASGFISPPVYCCLIINLFPAPLPDFSSFFSLPHNEALIGGWQRSPAFQGPDDRNCSAACVRSVCTKKDRAVLPRAPFASASFSDVAFLLWASHNGRMSHLLNETSETGNQHRGCYPGRAERCCLGDVAQAPCKGKSRVEGQQAPRGWGDPAADSRFIPGISALVSVQAFGSRGERMELGALIRIPRDSHLDPGASPIPAFGA